MGPIPATPTIVIIGYIKYNEQVEAKKYLKQIKEEYGQGAFEMTNVLISSFSQGLKLKDPNGDPEEEKDKANLRVAQALLGFIKKGELKFDQKTEQIQYLSKKDGYQVFHYWLSMKILESREYTLGELVYKTINEYHKQYGVEIREKDYSLGLIAVIGRMLELNK